MAATLGEKVGETVGLRVRLTSLVSKRTRIEVVTEGVFTRHILDDPALEGVAAVLFDEFHERSLDADLGLAFALDAQGALREDLRLLVMSATLDGARVRALLGDAPLIESEGRAFPVATRYVGRNPNARIEDEVARVTLDALDERERLDPRLPAGQGEIRRVAETLRARVRRPDVDIAPLYGALDARAQDLAVAPAPAGRRKIVLATSIAETSLTIEGVRVVIDCGLMRVPVYEPDVGLTRLETVRVSRANADQRRGRAGRIEPGVCYRLWEEAANGGLQPYAAPEILSADLSGFLLDCAPWGVADPARLAFLDPAAARRAEGGPRASDRDRRDRRARPHHRRGPRDREPRAAAAPCAHGRRRGARGRSADGERSRGRADRTRARRRRGRSRDPASKPSAATARRAPRTRGASRAGWRRARRPSSGLRPLLPEGEGRARLSRWPVERRAFFRKPAWG